MCGLRQAAAARDAREKEERIQLLRRQTVRRMMSQGLARGFTAWYALWEARTEARRLLQQAANRLSRPQLSSAFNYWQDDWREAEHLLKLAATNEREAGWEVQRAQLMEKVLYLLA